MEKRTILAIALSVLVLLVFQYFFQERRSAQQEVIRPAVRSEKSTEIPPPAPPPPTEANLAEEAPQLLSAEADTKAIAQKVIVEADLYRAVLDNRGALLTSWQLNRYKSAQGEIFDMIAANHDTEMRPYLGSLIFSDPSLTALANDELYGIEVAGSQYLGGKLSPPVSVIMRLQRGDLVIEKRYVFDKDNYLIDFSATLEKGGIPIAGQFLLGQDIGPEHEHLLSGATQLRAVFYQDGKVHREGPPSDENEVMKIEGGDVRWAGLDMKYFSIIAIPGNSLEFFNVQKRSVKAESLDGKEMDRDLLRLSIPLEGSGQYQLYLGPKEQTNLEAVGAIGLSGVIDYGMFSILVVPLLVSLKWVYQYIPNYGIAIVFLTLLLSLLLFPLRLKSMLSMKKMQAVQPKQKAIQEKYKKYKKTDPRRAEMNKEVMALYKEHGVNPLGGCLPLLVQMPFFIAFYSLLSNSIELRQAPFWGWIQDLSDKDPYYVLPIVMGITMFISQKMTPMTPGADPKQMKMMLWGMPIFMVWIFKSLSSGLNLYFLCSNIFQIAFQKIAERWMGDRKSGKKSKK